MLVSTSHAFLVILTGVLSHQVWQLSPLSLLASSHISLSLPLQAAEANGIKLMPTFSGPIFFLGPVVIKKEQRKYETVKWDQGLSYNLHRE